MILIMALSAIVGKMNYCIASRCLEAGDFEVGDFESKLIEMYLSV